MVEFSVIQQAPNAPAFANGTPVWRTCVRQVALVDDPRAIPPQAEAWHNEAAYAHLLEVVCGLHSPVIGETEVLHQFKVFADALAKDHPEWRDLCTRLMADARTIRATYLIGLGSRSYGSAVRRHVHACSRVAVVGTGMLAREIVPFVARGDRSIDLWGRRAECGIEAAGLTYRRLDAPHERIEQSAAIVIAAPIAATAIAALARRYANVTALIDLRAEGVDDPPPPIAPIVTLADIFAEFDAAARGTADRVAHARAAIAQCARAFAGRARLNPSGWHDLCA